ncbi:hypothetical protein B0H10DRAFT_2428806 [Mycena sp. CBHHK59/15]|nr:hypothetical protein B0H10DRAFT_2428806 [Mycena sp. CBHHK59/15]
MRRREGNTPEERVALFMKIICGAKCFARDSNGSHCQGGPILNAKPHGASRDHQYFVGCSGWTPKFQQGHRMHSIPDHVNENLLARALAGQPLTDDPSKDTPPCSGVVHLHIGLRRKHCPHAHIVDGTQIRARIINYPCNAIHYIYVPLDTTIRKALIIHNDTGHNHPMLILTKVSFGLKDTYRKCIEANGVLRATVSKIDDGMNLLCGTRIFSWELSISQSTKMVLNGKTPAAYAAPLHNKRVKQDLLHAAKLEKYPNGLDVDAIEPMFHADLMKPLPERYIHSYLKLLDDPGVTSFDGDTTFKGIEGKLNEWELTIFAKVVQRAASILRAYINRASTDFFELLFDELQHVKLMVTGKPIPLRKFVRGGNLLVTNVDMDPAQLIGLSRSVMKYNDPEYSGIPNDTPPEQIAPLFIKVCWRHGKEPVNDFESLVSTSDFDCLKYFVYIDSKEALNAFSAFVYGLGVEKITNWWRHKEMHSWIIPCLVKSQSLISADVWDSTPSTTNTNEAQHHWTNSLTGIKLTPVEAIESRRMVDLNFASEVKMSIQTGILSNPNNEMSHHMARNSQRHSAAACKAHESCETKTLRAQLKASSSGRVRTARPRAAPAPPLATQSENISTAALTVPTTATQSATPSVPEFDSAQPTTGSAFDFLPDFNFDFNMFMDSSSLEGANTGGSFPAQAPSADPLTFDLTFDPALFGLSADFNAAIPSGALPEDPLQDFLNSYGISGISTDLGTTANFGTFTLAGPFIDPLPLLPLPLPESPPAPSPAVERSSEPGPSAPRLRRSRQEVDEANIVTSMRSRAPTERKQFADQDISN